MQKAETLMKLRKPIGIGKNFDIHIWIHLYETHNQYRFNIEQFHKKTSRILICFFTANVFLLLVWNNYKINNVILEFVLLW